MKYGAPQYILVNQDVFQMLNSSAGQSFSDLRNPIWREGWILQVVGEIRVVTTEMKLLLLDGTSRTFKHEDGV